MGRQYREAEMSPAVCAWIKSQGYSVYAEIDVSSPIDHVGVRWSDLDIICVEMKCHLTHGLIRQAIVRQLITPRVYCAVPRMPRFASLELLRRYELGLIVAGEVVFEPTCRRDVIEHYREKLLRLCRQAEEGGIGGMPAVKGDGPAIRVAAAVAKYREEHPTANWQEIFAKVPNHYAHARSMQGAMSRVTCNR